MSALMLTECVVHTFQRSFGCLVDFVHETQQIVSSQKEVKGKTKQSEYFSQ